VQKFFIITAFILLSSMTAAAQTAAEQKPVAEGRRVEFAAGVEIDRVINAPVISARTESGAGRVQVERIVDGRVLRLGPTTTYLKNGLSVDEVVKLLGKPSAISQRLEGNSLITIYIFPRSQSRVLIAQFENGLLTDSRTETVEVFERERGDR
jgi:hypothetical protein